ncbi:MAG: msba3 [Chlamydiales bacterium]|jgi:ABC-type multidrug transport system fused ATPase/permease subunit|nr:msba3 [Chlamydiales bacterium]
MYLLFKAALYNRRHYSILVLTLFAMLVLMAAESMEALALGILSQKGQQLVPQQSASIGSNLNISSISFLQTAISYLEKIFNFDDVWGIASFLISVALFKGVAAFCNSYATAVVGIRVSRDLRLRYFEHIQSLPLNFFQKYPIGNLMARVSGDASVIASSINSVLFTYIQIPITFISTLTLCFLISWKLSLISFVALPLLTWPILFFARKIKKIAVQMQRNQELSGSSLIDFLAGIQTIKMFGMEVFAGRKYAGQNALMAKLQEKNARYAFASRPIIHLIATLCIAAVILYGFHGARMSIPEILFFCACLHKLYDPIKKFNEANNEIQKGIAAAERMFEVLQIQPSINDCTGAIELEKFENSIEFDDVWFKYEDEWVLKGLSFRIEPGQTVALVGSTGAGKSTIIQLLMRLYEVQKGEIRIDGKPLHIYKQQSLRRFFGVVPQKPFLFLDSIAENIAFGQSASEEEIKEASIKAYAAEFIEKLPQKYETLLAEGGRNLSGGQQQRLAIARALVKKSSIIILDEATSSLDANSELYIKTALSQLQGQMTQIIIAHRLSTIEHADKIIYIDDGKVLAQGDKQYLLDHCLPFKYLWELNMGFTAEVSSQPFS